MSEKRMFSKTVIDSDAFLDMPLSAQALYFHLSMRADDEGFINNSRKIQRVLGASDGDLRTLVQQNFIIPFDSGVMVIKHWKLNNNIRSDRKKATVYPDEKALLIEKENGVYALKDKPTGGAMPRCESSAVADCQHSIGELREGEDSIDEHTAKDKETEKDGVCVGYACPETSPPQKDYSQQVFDILFAHDLPCCNGNYITFCMRDFKLALDDIRLLHLDSGDVIQAVRNYAEVIEMKRRGETWWNSEQNFYNLCKSRNILKFLPGEFAPEKFVGRTSGGLSGGLPAGRIRL